MNFLAYRPKFWLFEGQSSGRYSKTSCRNIAKKYISKNHRFHDLRHSFAKYLVDQDTNLNKIRDLLGHSTVKTTEIYTHVSMKAMQEVSLPI